MKTLAYEARAKNVTAYVQHGETVCRWCGDTGFVVVQTRTDRWVQRVPHRRTDEKGATQYHMVPREAEHEEFGPCPFCERGYFEEFGDGEADAKVKHRASRWPWEKDGYWAGRDDVELVPLVSAAPPLSREETLARMRAILALFEPKEMLP